MSWLSKLKKGLSKTASLFSFSRVDEVGLEQMEEALLCSDVGYTTTSEIMDTLRRYKPKNGDELYRKLTDILVDKVTPVAQKLKIDTTQ
jgi:fused signal recognition particle receptor